MARYQREGGVLVLELWDPPEDADPSPWVTTAEEAARVVSMMERTELNGDEWLQESQYLIWTAAGGIQHRMERTRLGAFSRADWSDHSCVPASIRTTSTRVFSVEGSTSGFFTTTCFTHHVQ